MDSDSASTGVIEAASNGLALRIEGMQYRLSGLGAFAARLGDEERICLRRVIVWFGRLFPVTEIESAAFSSSLLKSIVIPRTVEIRGLDCFSFCGSLSSISIESDCKMNRIEFEAFLETRLTSVAL
jgi:hypothetical protein